MLRSRDMILRTLVELHHLKGEDGDQWLSSFEAKLIKEAKNLVPEGIGIEDEIAGHENAITYIKYLFGRARRQIAQESRDIVRLMSALH
jgi:hypothetical protein